MTRGSSLAPALISVLLLAAPAIAQVGVPGNGPLTPDGPRRGLGPPSITDNVPDLRLQPSGGVPIYTPPVYRGGSQPRASDRAPLARRGRVSVIGYHCLTPKKTCSLAKPRTLETSCTCRLSKAGRMRGNVVR